MLSSRIIIIAAISAAVTACAQPARTGAGAIEPNDNTRPAGTLSNGVLSLALETRVGSWQPDGAGGRSVDSMEVFAEVGHAPVTPGPLIRVPVGTEVRGTLHNTLNRPLHLFGLGKTRTLDDSTMIPAGATMPFEFHAGDAGTFAYAAYTRLDTLLGRDPKDMQLNGVIVVDRPNAPADRIMAITWYFTSNPKSPTGFGSGVMAINGLTWPHTEHLQYTEGDSVRWRVVNLTDGDHPMHLHGFYFRVDSRSGNGVDTLYATAQQRMAVTEMINPFTAVSIAWQAARAGTWIFHCHYAAHLSTHVTLDTRDGDFDSTMMMQHPSDRPHQMFGLVMGITIAPKGAPAGAAAPDRRIRIEQREKAGVSGQQPGMSYAMTDDKPSDPVAMPVPGPSLILERGKRVAVTVVNQSSQSAAVHWHGIELESYADGVPGWSGTTGQMYPPIAPHDSLTVRWTPPRAGSFMYHSHFNEAAQMGAGLYGPIIVLDPGERYDPETDRVLFFGTAGAVGSVFGRPPAVLLNGDEHPEPMQLKAGTHYRFRLFNLAGDNPTVVSLTQHGKPVEWTAVAKDGYPLPPSQAIAMPAKLMFDPGEIYDFAFTPLQSGEYTLSFGLPQPPPPPPRKKGEPAPPPSTVPPLVNVAVHVRKEGRTGCARAAEIVASRVGYRYVCRFSQSFRRSNR